MFFPHPRPTTIPWRLMESYIVHPDYLSIHVSTRLNFLLFQMSTLFIASLAERFKPLFTGSRYISIILPVYYILKRQRRLRRFLLLPAVFARPPQIYEVPFLLHIQTMYIVYNVVHGVTERKFEIHITPS